MKGEQIFKYPDDDGRASRPWIKKGERREEDSCKRVRQVLEERPWVIGNIVEVAKNSDEDSRGVDMFVPMDNRLLEYLDIKKERQGVPFQIKSSYKTCVEFVHSHEIFKKGVYRFSNGDYVFVINGLDAKEIVAADIVGQIVGLAKRRGIPESDALFFLAEELADRQAVESYIDQKVILEEVAWYLRRPS
jgi:hypothetical protein